MALTILQKATTKMAGLLVTIVQLTFDNNYAGSGGEALTPAQLGLRVVEDILFEDEDGYRFRYDRTNKKVIALHKHNVYTAAVDPASIAADTAANTQVAVAGVTTADRILAIPPNDLESGLVLQAVWVSAADTIQVRLLNTTAGAIDGASKTWTFIVYRDQDREVKAGTDLSAVVVRAVAFGR